MFAFGQVAFHKRCWYTGGMEVMRFEMLVVRLLFFRSDVFQLRSLEAMEAGGFEVEGLKFETFID